MREHVVILITKTEVESVNIANHLSSLRDSIGSVSFSTLRPDSINMLEGLETSSALIIIHAPVAPPQEQAEFLQACLRDLERVKFEGKLFLVSFSKRLTSSLPQQDRSRFYEPGDLYGAVKRSLVDTESSARRSGRLLTSEKAMVEVDMTRSLFQTRLKSVSRDGAAVDFSGDQRLQVGEVVSLHLPPGVGKPAVTIKCRVAWIERTGRESDALASAGLQFLRGA